MMKLSKSDKRIMYYLLEMFRYYYSMVDLEDEL